MVKTEEAAHGRRVEKRRVEGAGVGSAQDVHSAVPWRVGRAGEGSCLCPMRGGNNSKYDGTSSVLHLKLSVLAYVSNVQTLMHCGNEADNYHPRAACALRV
jgi:hypothetical protein